MDNNYNKLINNLEKLNLSTVKNYVKSVIGNHIQIAGDETCGRGIFSIDWTDSKLE